MVGVRRMLRWFERDGDAFVGEVELPGVPVAELQRLVSAPADDPLVDCWPLPAERLDELAALAEVPVGLERFACFVEADAEPGAAADGGGR